MRRVTKTRGSIRFNWSFPPGDVALGPEEIHVWAANLDDLHRQDLAACLSVDEQERAARFRFDQDRRRFISARGLLRELLARYVQEPPDQLHFCYGTNGKPELDGCGEKCINFNLSHSNELGIFAVSRQRALGIDLEKIHGFNGMDDVAARCFLPEEQSVLQLLAGPQKEENFFRYWTRIEAQLKCVGDGFSGAARKRFDGFIHELSPAENFIATLAVRGSAFTLRTWQMTAA